MKEFDVAVVGAGPAGVAAALSLAAAGRSVLLLSRPDSADRRAGEVLTPVIGPLLAQLCVWERFLDSGARPAHAIWSAWGGTSAGVVSKDFVAGPHGPAWRVDRPHFDAMLLAAAVAAGVQVSSARHRVAAQRDGGGWRVTRSAGPAEPPARCRFLIDATGRAATVARSNGARWIGRDRAVALIALLEPRRGLRADAEEVLLVESAAAGWWYSSVLPGGELVAAFVTDGDLIRSEAGAPEGAWSRALAQTSVTVLRAAGFSRRGFHVRRAGCGRLDRAAGPGWVAVGDAASVVDPLSGVGITKALKGAMVAAAAVNQALDGDASGLDQYADGVRAELEASLRIGGEYYRSERRWPESPFWKRRQSSLSQKSAPRA